MAVTEAKLELSQPRRFNTGAMAAISAYSLLLILPVLAAGLYLTLKFSLWSLCLPFLAIAATASILPLGLGNAQVSRLVRRFCPGAGTGPHSFIVQLTLSPRSRDGLWALVEDADDIGCLNLADSELVYWGDSVTLTLPWHQVRRISLENVGLRGLFLYGRIVITVSGLPQTQTLNFSERSSWLLPRSRAQTRALYQCLLDTHARATRPLSGSPGQKP